MKQAGVKIIRNEEQKEVNSIMYKKGKVYILRDEKLRAEIIQLHYNIPIEGHSVMTWQNG